jgi:hypothetical protein
MPIKKYRDFRINEELFGLTRAEKIERRRTTLQDSLDRYLPIWIRKKSIDIPSKADLDKFWDDAKNDDYMSGNIVGGSGGVGIGADKKLMYRKSSDIKTKGQGLEGVSENVDIENDLVDQDVFSRDGAIDTLSSEYDQDILNDMDDSDLEDMLDKKEMDEWLRNQDELG